MLWLDKCKGKSCRCRHVSRGVFRSQIIPSDSILAGCPPTRGSMPRPSNIPSLHLPWLPQWLDALEGHADSICSGYGVHREVLFEPTFAFAFRSLGDAPRNILEVDSGPQSTGWEDLCSTCLRTTGNISLYALQLKPLLSFLLHFVWWESRMWAFLNYKTVYAIRI